MAMQQQGKQPEKPNGHKSFPWRRLIITIVILLLIIIIAVEISNIQSSIILAVLGIAIGLFQWFFPFTSNMDTPAKSPVIPQSATPSSPEIKVQVARQSSPANANSPDSIFLFNVHLPDYHELYGRLRERQTLINRSRNGASTSIVGPRRIGKTWLIDYLKLVTPSELGTRFRIAYLDATMASCTTVAGFTNKVLEELGVHTFVADNAALGLTALEKVVQELKAKNQTPLLCVDEFESLVSRQAFDLNFFIGMRALTQAGLGLIVASKKPLFDVIGDPGTTSGFFNVFEQLTLKPFSLEEAELFAQMKSTQARFNEKERNYLLQYGRRLGEDWPIRMQLVGKMLLEDKGLAEREDPHYYRPNDLSYWQDFEERLEEKYKGVAGK